MLQDRARKAGHLHRLLLIVRSLSDAVIQGSYENGVVVKVKAASEQQTGEQQKEIEEHVVHEEDNVDEAECGGDQEPQQKKYSPSPSGSGAKSASGDIGIYKQWNGISQSWGALSPQYLHCLDKVEKQAWNILHGILDCTDTYLKPCPPSSIAARRTNGILPRSSKSEKSSSPEQPRKSVGKVKRGPLDIGLRGSIFFGRQPSYGAGGPDDSEGTEKNLVQEQEAATVQVGDVDSTKADSSLVQSQRLQAADPSSSQPPPTPTLSDKTRRPDDAPAHKGDRRKQYGENQLNLQPHWNGPGPDAGGGGGTGGNRNSFKKGAGDNVDVAVQDEPHGAGDEKLKVRTNLPLRDSSTLHSLPPSPYPESSNIKRFAELLNPRTGKVEVEGGDVFEEQTWPPPAPLMSPRTHHHPHFHQVVSSKSVDDKADDDELQRSSTPQHHQWRPLQNPRKQIHLQADTAKGIQELKSSLREPDLDQREVERQLDRKSYVETHTFLFENGPNDRTATNSGVVTAPSEETGNNSSAYPDMTFTPIGLSNRFRSKLSRTKREVLIDHIAGPMRHGSSSQAQAGLLKLAFRAVSHTRAAPLATAEMMGTAAPPSKYTRLWPWYAFYGFIMAGVGLWSLRNSKKVNELLK